MSPTRGGELARLKKQVNVLLRGQHSKIKDFMDTIIQVVVDFKVHLVPLEVLIYIVFKKVHLTEGSKKKKRLPYNPIG